MRTLKRRDFLRYGAMGLVAAVAPGTLRGRAATAKPRAGEIVRCAIHPALGVARVGNSPAEFFLGAEVPGVFPTPEGGFKDATGRLKRQAVRFRVFGLDADGNIVQELTSADAEISWTVHLANKKAAWYNFDMPLDLPVSTGAPIVPDASPTPPIASTRRNSRIPAGQRAALVIDPGPRTIAGANRNSDGNESAYAFDTGHFIFSQQRIYLGELRTDADGRLLVLGGRGVAASSLPHVRLNAGDNDFWYDDIADGPVDAMVRIGDRVLEVESAWAVVAPPDYAPGVQSVTTMYDVLFAVATTLEPRRHLPRPSFTRQILPLFARHVQQQWVNARFAREFGWGAPGNFLDAGTLRQLADRSPANRFLRTQVFRRFREPTYPNTDYSGLPPYFGDTVAPGSTAPHQYLALLPLQYGWLQQWADGDFDADLPAGELRPAQRLEDLPIEERPAALDRAALDECLGGPFHPGVELTWPMRIPLLYRAPFRLNQRTGLEPDWGDALTAAVALKANGPLSASGPGDLTRWMAVPWQVDEAGCLAGLLPATDPYPPSFWPAKVPDEVLSWASYQTILDPAAPAATKQAAFTARSPWLPGVVPFPDGYIERINAMLDLWHRLGVVTRVSGPVGDPAFPNVLWVERDGLNGGGPTSGAAPP